MVTFLCNEEKDVEYDKLRHYLIKWHLKYIEEIQK